MLVYQRVPGGIGGIPIFQYGLLENPLMILPLKPPFTQNFPATFDWRVDVWQEETHETWITWFLLGFSLRFWMQTLKFCSYCCSESWGRAQNCPNVSKSYGKTLRFARKVRMEFKYYPWTCSKSLRRASVLVFTRRRTLNPKILKPWKLWTRKQKTLRIRSIFNSIFCNFSSHVRRRGILNVAVRATGFVLSKGSQKIN